MECYEQGLGDQDADTCLNCYAEAVAERAGMELAAECPNLRGAIDIWDARRRAWVPMGGAE
jgi:hypothetical protein